jgi:hydroxypyruvate isomerase
MSDDSQGITRREALGRMAAAAAFGATAALAPMESAFAVPSPEKSAPGRLKQSLSRWTSKAPLPELCKRLKAIGFVAVDLLYSDEWAVVNDSGLKVSMGYPARRDDFIAMGFNDPANHATLLKELETTIPLAKQAGVTNVITMFGNRKPGIDDSQAIDNCVAACRRLPRWQPNMASPCAWNCSTARSIITATKATTPRSVSQ